MTVSLRVPLAFLLMLFALARPGVAAQEPDFADVHKAALTAYVQRLAELSLWCTEQQLFLERDRVLRAMLELDPLNLDVRKALRFSKAKDGSWVEPAPREAKNRNPKALEELPKRRQMAVEPYRTALVAAMNKASSNTPTRRGVQREILLGDPDDVWVRAVQGEVKLGEEWLLQETATAKKRRGEIKELAQTSLAGVGLFKPTALTGMEESLGVTFNHKIATADVRVLGTGLLDECERAARFAQAAGPFLRGIFGFDTRHQIGFTIYMLANPKEETLLLANMPGIEPAFRDFLQHVVGTLIPGQPRVVYWDPDPSHRVDGASRQTISDFLGRSYGFSMNQGWAWEGFGIYLNRELAGTRLTWFIQMAGGGKHNALRKRLMMADSNWMNEALTLLSQNDHPRFGQMLESDVNAMGIPDMLYAYAFTAYLLEGRPTDAPEILKRIGLGKETSTSAVEAVLRMDLFEVEERLFRWLSERR